MSKLLGFIVLVLIGIPIALLGGFVLSDLWDWFIVPVFVGAPPLTYLQAVGLLLVAGIFKIGLEPLQIGDKDDRDNHPLLIAAATQFGYAVAYLLTWGLGAIWAHFIL